MIIVVQLVYGVYDYLNMNVEFLAVNDVISDWEPD